MEKNKKPTLTIIVNICQYFTSVGLSNLLKITEVVSARVKISI